MQLRSEEIKALSETIASWRMEEVSYFDAPVVPSDVRLSEYHMCEAISPFPSFLHRLTVHSDLLYLVCE